MNVSLVLFGIIGLASGAPGPRIISPLASAVFTVPDPKSVGPMSDDQLAPYFPKSGRVVVRPPQRPIFAPPVNLLAINVNNPHK
jgi:hypothetical protein